MEKEIGRITHDGIQYVLGVYMWDFSEKVPSPYILITTRSSRKNREEKPSEKDKEHFNRISVKNPIGFYTKAYPVFERFLTKYNYVHFTAHDDSQEKRERVYTRALEKMGFELVYVHETSWREKHFIMAKKGIKPKRKEIKKVFSELESDD
jgi:hypothetical protein